MNYWPERTNTRDALLDAGHLIAVPNMHGDTWGNHIAQADIKAVHDWIAAHWTIHGTFLLAESMGGNAAANVITHETIPVDAVFFVVPSVNLIQVWERGDATSAAMGEQFGVAPDGSDFLTRTADWDGLRAPTSAYAGVRAIVLGATDDTVVRYTETVAPFADKLDTAGVLVEHITVTGGHNSADRYPVARIRDLFVALPADTRVWDGVAWSGAGTFVYQGQGWALASAHYWDGVAWS